MADNQNQQNTPGGENSPAQQPNGANQGSNLRPSDAGKKAGTKVKAKAVNHIDHGLDSGKLVSIKPGTIFSGDAGWVLPLIASGAAVHFPPRAEDSPEARSAAIVKGRQDAADQMRASGVDPSDLEIHDEYPSSGTPQARQAQDTRRLTAAGAAERRASGVEDGPKTDAFGRVVSPDHDDKVAQAATELSRDAARTAAQTRNQSASAPTSTNPETNRERSAAK